MPPVWPQTGRAEWVRLQGAVMIWRTGLVAIGLAVALAAQGSPVRLYPLGSSMGQVALEDNDFIQSVPLQSAGFNSPYLSLPEFNPVIGHRIGQHPGGFVTGMPAPNAFFVGVFAHALDTHDPGAMLYLWETSCCPGHVALYDGPLVELGFWSGETFTALGIPPMPDETRSALYRTTGVLADDHQLQIGASAVRLPELGLPLGYEPPYGMFVNAIRVRPNPWGHNQVTAIAATQVAEPAVAWLLLPALVMLRMTRRSRGRPCKLS